MPQAVNGVDYTIKIIDNRELAVDYLDKGHIKFLPSNVTGSIVKGNNKISRNNGIVSIENFEIH